MYGQTMRAGMRLIFAVGVMLSPVLGSEFRNVLQPTVGIVIDHDALRAHGLALGSQDPADPAASGTRVERAVSPRGSQVSVLVESGELADAFADELFLQEGLSLISARNGREVTVSQLDVVSDADDLGTDARRALGAASLEMHGVRVGYSRAASTITMPSENLRISRGLAEALGESSLEGVSIGHAVFRGRIAQEVDAMPGAQSALVPVLRDVQDSGTAAAPDGPDVTFCELYGLQQFGRVGSVVGMALATTSWNIGSKDAKWFDIPDTRHPFIVSNLYRAKGDRFEHIGQSWVKHGFFALGDEQCSTNCTYEAGHGEGDWLGVGCTDTYSSGLNANQSSLGPRHEINPWSGTWTYTGSHMDPGPPAEPPHNAISHRLQVHDDDLNPALNAGATYYAEGYYVVFEDVTHLNNASWKTVTFTGVPGGNWAPSMSGFNVRPTSGIALDAWSGARRTTIAQVVPVIEGTSPDGRCILAAKATDLGGGNWHYEYALLNLDMHRKANSFSVPLRAGTVVTNVAFHAVRSHDEPFSNDAWTVTGGSPTDDFIAWGTTTNPIRWGTLYNFRFDANVGPGDTTITVGLHDAGTPSSVSGVTTGPNLLDPACPAESPVSAAPTQPRNRYLSVSPVANGLQTAMRVRLASLLHPAGAQVASGGMSKFEGEDRWVGPPTTFSEGPGGSALVGAALQCEPYFHNWGTAGTVHIYGAEIMPSSTYEVQMIHANCAGEIGNESRYSSIVQVDTGEWGDTVAPYAGEPGSGTQPNFLDVSAIVMKYQGQSGAPSKARAQLQPNSANPAADVSFLDISAGVAAFSGAGYTFPGPSSCP